MTACSKCNSVDRYADGRCKACCSIRAGAYRLKNAESLKEKKRIYAAKNSERERARSAQWSLDNPGRKKATAAAYRAKTADKAKAYKAEWSIRNSSHVVEKVRQWRKANPGAHRANNENRRARKSASNGKLSKGIAQRLMALQKGLCACCRQPLGEKYHLDHIMPLALGGSNTDDNMQLLRQRCNNQKNAKHPIDFMQERGFLL